MWRYAIDDAIEQGVAGFLCLGDATEVGVEVDEILEIGALFRRMRAHGWVIEVDGNHGVRHGMRWASLLDVDVVDDRFARVVLRDAGGYVAMLLCAPYCRRGYAPYPNVDAGLEENYAAAARALADAVADAKTEAASLECPLIVAGHWTPAGFRVSPSDFEQTGGKEMVVPVEYLAQADLVLVGHIHEAQEFGNIHGVGSLFRTTFAERDQIKCYSIIEIESHRIFGEASPHPTHLIHVERRPLPTRPMIQVRVSGKSAPEIVQHILADGPNQDVKVIVETTQDDQTVYADILAPLEGLAGQFTWEVNRETHVATRAPEIEAAATLTDDFTVWLPMTYPDLDPARRAGVLSKVADLEAEVT